MSDEDTFYDYRDFKDERAINIFTAWDNYGGNHGVVLKTCAELLVGDTALDVGCGLCHLYPLLETEVDEYVGVDIDERAVEIARERYPHLRIDVGSVYDLDDYGVYDTVYAIGLYRRLNETQGLHEMLKHTRKTLIFTIWQPRENPKFPEPLWEILRGGETHSVELISNNIIGTDIIKINKNPTIINR